MVTKDEELVAAPPAIEVRTAKVVRPMVAHVAPIAAERTNYDTFLGSLREVVSELEHLQAGIRQRQALVGDGIEAGTAKVQSRAPRLSAEVLANDFTALGAPLLPDSSPLEDGKPGISYRLEAMYFVARRVVSDATADTLFKEVIDYSIQLGQYRFAVLVACEMRAVSNADNARGKVVEAALKEGDFAFALVASELIENRSTADGAKSKVIKALRGAGKNASPIRVPYS